MTILNMILALVGVVLLVGAVRLSWRNRGLGLRLDSGLAALTNRAGKRQLDLIEFRNRTRLVEDTVRTSTAAVEVVHRAITSTTFEVIDRLSTSEKFRTDARRARTVHDTTSRSFYQSLRATNRTLHALANVVMDTKAERKYRNQSRRSGGRGEKP